MKWIPKRLYEKITKIVPLLCVDLVFKKRNKTLLIKRKIPPYKGYWCLVGGRVFYGERVTDAVYRQAKNETGLRIKIERLIGVYDSPKRDPSKHAISLAYIVTPIGGNLRTGPESDEIKFFSKLPAKIGFDHKNILKDAGFI
jgi:8-oxo-dGTP diphosphatase